MITNKVRHRENWKNSSLFFQSLLAPQRTLFLFQSVLALVISVLWTNPDQDALPLKDVLNCRQVCKLWNVGIDKFILDSHHIAEGTNAIQEILSKNICYNFWYDEDFHQNSLFRFFEHFKLTHPGQPETRSPFIHPRLSISTPDSYEYDDEHEEGLQHFIIEISTLLQRYGMHVTDFTLDIDGYTMDLDLISRLQNWLTSIPNLKRLAINDNSEHLDIELLELHEFLLTSPFPLFKCLQSIDIRHLKASLFNNLICRNNHISTLHAKEGEEEYDIFTFPLPNLKALKFKPSTDSIDIVKKLSSPNVELPLTSLTISFGIVHEFLKWSELFQIIEEKFAKTLVNLSFKLPMACGERGAEAWWNSEDPLKINLPNLREIYLSTHMPISLDFLLPMKDSLKVIFVRARYILPKNHEETKKSVVQFYGFESEDKILDSNIWSLFTNLEKIGIRLGCGRVTWFHREHLSERKI